MELLVKLLTVFGLGAVELWIAIPAGFAMKLPPSLTRYCGSIGCNAWLANYLEPWRKNKEQDAKTGYR